MVAGRAVCPLSHTPKSDYAVFTLGQSPYSSCVFFSFLLSTAIIDRLSPLGLEG